MTRTQAALLKMLIVLGALELSVRVLSGVGALYLPPSDVSGFDRAFVGENAPVRERLYEADRNLISRMRPDVDMSYDRLVVLPAGKASYHVHTNSSGFRTPEVSEKKPAGVFRIVCLGDSSTFGFNVEEVDTYPRVLERLLAEAHPGRFEVLNFGVPGYSSRQGLELIRQVVLRYDPDLITFAFGTNDRFWRRPLSDDELIKLNQSLAGGFLIPLRSGLDHVYTFRLLQRAVAGAIYRFADRRVMEQQTGQLRVGLDGIRDAIIAAQAELGKRGGSLIALNNDFFGTDAWQGIAAGASAAGVPYLDMHGLFATKRSERTREIERAHGLPPARPQTDTLLFRVETKDTKRDVVLQAGPIFAAPVDTVPMRDDGEGGDQVAGDGIWSASVPVNKVAGRTYQYWVAAGAEPAPEFQCKAGFNATRRPSVDHAGIGDIDTFGEIYLHSDSSHPDEEGHAVIARELLPYVLAAERATH